MLRENTPGDENPGMPSQVGIDVLRAARRSGASRTCGSPRIERLRREALELAAEPGLIEAAFSYRIMELEGPAATAGLSVAGEILEAPDLIPRRGRLTAVACAVCTLGAGLEQRVDALFRDKRPSLALVLDELGTELLFSLSERVVNRVRVEVRRRGLTVAGELRAGDPGLALEAQASVLRLAQAADIGVQLSDGQLMRPFKSTSLMLGVGIDLPAATWSRCDRCPSKAKCRAYARTGAAA